MCFVRENENFLAIKNAWTKTLNIMSGIHGHKAVAFFVAHCWSCEQNKSIFQSIKNGTSIWKEIFADAELKLIGE